MPNHCYNRVQLSNNADDDSKQFDELVAKFESQTPFAEILPRPDFSKIKNEDGELPVLEQKLNPDGSIFYETYNFPDGKNDDRWYHWCIANWGTKWEPDIADIEYADSEQLQLTFSTAWSPPEGIVEKLREKYPDLSFSCFYDEPGCQVAGYY